jgi:hypothetical protein
MKMKRALVVLVVLFLAACGSSAPLVPLTPDWPTEEPGDYTDVTDTWTRATNLRGAYQEVLELAATFKSPEWRAAYAARDAEYRRLNPDARKQRIAQAQAEMAGPWELELMVTTWDRRENDLDRGKRSVWRLVLIDDAGNEIEPLEIVKDKRPAFTLRADYPAFGDFAVAYVARFPRTAPVLGPGVKQVRLRMSSSRGSVELAWTAR